ncbi:30S ribosomal protein S4 [bacterium]|nr:30S ribosomal protein S4 [candidate division CSSED10-310 bacterium]
MARYTNSICRICRREGEKLFLKGNRCFSEKCAFDRRSYPPGQHGQRKPRLSNYGIQLREKQKVKRTYGLLEKQFKNLFKKAVRMKGVTGENLMMLLESRLDSVLYRSGFAISRNQARQLINHGHFSLNGKKVDIASHQIKPGDVISVKERSKNLVPIQAAIESVREVPEWLKVDSAKVSVEVLTAPTRDTIKMTVQEQLIVEFFSR